MWLLGISAVTLFMTLVMTLFCCELPFLLTFWSKWKIREGRDTSCAFPVSRISWMPPRVSLVISWTDENSRKNITVSSQWKHRSDIQGSVSCEKKPVACCYAFFCWSAVSHPPSCCFEAANLACLWDPFPVWSTDDVEKSHVPYLFTGSAAFNVGERP